MFSSALTVLFFILVTYLYWELRGRHRRARGPSLYLLFPSLFLFSQLPALPTNSDLDPPQMLWWELTEAVAMKNQQLSRDLYTSLLCGPAVAAECG